MVASKLFHGRRQVEAARVEHISFRSDLYDARLVFLANIDDPFLVDLHLGMKAEVIAVRIDVFREKGRDYDFPGRDAVHDLWSGEYHLSSNPIREGTTVLEFRYLPPYGRWLPLFRQKQTLPIDIPL